MGYVFVTSKISIIYAYEEKNIGYPIFELQGESRVSLRVSCVKYSALAANGMLLIEYEVKKWYEKYENGVI